VLHALHENMLPFINDGAPVPVVEITTGASLSVIAAILVVTLVVSLRSPAGRAQNAVTAARRHATEYLEVHNDPDYREEVFARLVREIDIFMAAHPEERPWTCTVYSGTDGSTVFRGGVGHSLVIDPEGRLWRARSYEDFDTTYRFAGSACEIDTLTPLYAQMREYQARPGSSPEPAAVGAP